MFEKLWIPVLCIQVKYVMIFDVEKPEVVQMFDCFGPECKLPAVRRWVIIYVYKSVITLVSEYSIVYVACIVPPVHKDPKSRKDLRAVVVGGRTRAHVSSMCFV
jgi:hypothetical protein